MKKTLLILFVALYQFGFCDKYVWNSKAPLPADPRHRSCALSIGNKGYMGMGRVHTYSSSGGSVVWINYNDWWEYDPATNAWSQKADAPFGFNTGATFSIGGKGYVGTGDGAITPPGSGTYYGPGFGESNYFIMYDPILNTWTRKADVPISQCESIGFSINGKGYIGAGRSYSGASSIPLCEYNPVTDTWTILPYTNAIRSSRMPCAFVCNNKGYILESCYDTYSTYTTITKFWEFDPASSTVAVKATFIGTTPVGCTAFSVKGIGYIGLGGARDFYTYDPFTNIWDTLNKSFPGVHRGYAPSFVVGDNAYFGTGSNGTNLADLWCYEWKISVGINEYDKESLIKIFPNPTSDFININLSKAKDVSKLQFKLFTLDGKEVLKSNLIDESTNLDVTHLSNGIYIYTITDENLKLISSEKIIIN